MSNPTGPDQPDEATEAAPEVVDDTAETGKAEAVTDSGHEPATEILLSPEAEAQLPAEETNQPAERRYTAPSNFDASSTQIIDRPSDPATEVMPPVSMAQQKPVAPQVIPPRTETARPPRTRRSWGWVVAVILVIAALAAVAILGTLLLTRDSTPKVSQEDKVRSTIQNFDVAIQKGDLATLRTITCGTTRDSYVNYEERAWTEPMPGSPRPSSTRWSPASTRWWSTVAMRRPMSPRSWPTPLRPVRRAASTYSSETTSGRSARRPTARAAATSRSRWRSAPPCTGCRSRLGCSLAR